MTAGCTAFGMLFCVLATTALVAIGGVVLWRLLDQGQRTRIACDEAP